jgi:hypothetical protein
MFAKLEYIQLNVRLFLFLFLCFLIPNNIIIFIQKIYLELISPNKALMLEECLIYLYFFNLYSKYFKI